MLTKWGLATAALIGLLVGAPGTATAQEQPVDALPGTVSSTLQLKLERDGMLSVTERITVPPGQPVQRTMPLRQSAGPGADRVFEVSNATVDGGGAVQTDAENVRLTLQPGVSTLKYAVRGAVADAGDLQEVQWQLSGGWNVPVDRVEVASLLSPKVPQDIMCLSGPVGSEHRCAQFEVTHTQSVHALTFGLKPGDRMDFFFKVPAGTVPVNAVTDEYFSPATAFSLTPATAAGLAGIGLVLIGGIGLIWYARGRDVRAFAEEADRVEVLMADEQGAITFASPDGVLPGQIGTVIDERVDPVDVTVTVIDLAVRNYLWIEELPSDDWRIVPLNPPDESLRPFERAVYELLVGSEQEVQLSELRELDVDQVRAALYEDVVDKEWFARRPDADRNRFWWIGLGITIGGAALTVALALTSTVALLGVGVVVGGVAAMLSARLMPARTRRGSALVVQVRGLRGYLHEVSAESLPETDRETVFSRSLPYAVVLDETDRWLTEFAELDPGADGTPGLYWYATQDTAPNLQRFRETFPTLTARLNDLVKS